MYWLYNKYKQGQKSLAFFKLHDLFHLKVPTTAQQIAVNHTESMLSSSSDDSRVERRWKICDKHTRGALAWEQECKVLNCSTQESTANPPSKIPYAAAGFSWCTLSDTFWWLSQQPHVCFWGLKVSWKRFIPANATVSSEFDGDVLSKFWFQVGWQEPDAFFPTHFVGYLDNLVSLLEILKVSWKVCFQANATVSSEVGGNLPLQFQFQVGWLVQMHFCRCISLAIITTSSLFLKFESVLESLYSGKCDCLLRIWLRSALAILIGTGCIFADTFCWLSQQPHVSSLSLKGPWKRCIQANAIVSSESGGDVFLQFGLQAGWLKPDAFLPTLFVGYHANSWNLKESWRVCIQANVTVSSEFDGNVFSWFRFQVGWL